MDREELLKELESWNAVYKLGMDHLEIGNDLEAFMNDIHAILERLYDRSARATLRLIGAPIVVSRVIPTPHK